MDISLGPKDVSLAKMVTIGCPTDSYNVTILGMELLDILAAPDGASSFGKSIEFREPGDERAGEVMKSVKEGPVHQYTCRETTVKGVRYEKRTEKGSKEGIISDLHMGDAAQGEGADGAANQFPSSTVNFVRSED